MSSKKENPSAILSKEWIIESFLDMLAVKPLSSISISEIAENAKVDRRTFYRHFKSKNEVMRYYIHDVAKQFEKIFLHNNINDIYLNAKTLYEVLLTMKETLLIVHKQNLLDMFISDFETIYEKYQYEIIHCQKPEILKLDNIDYYLAYERGGIINIVKKYIAENCINSPGKMGKIFENYVFSLKKNI